MVHDLTITKPHPEIYGMGMRIRISNGWHWVLTKYVLVAISVCVAWFALKGIARQFRPLRRTTTTQITTGENPTSTTWITPNSIKIYPFPLLIIASLGMLIAIAVHIVRNSHWYIFDRFTIGSGNLNIAIDPIQKQNQSIHSEPIDSTKSSYYYNPAPSDPEAIANSRYISSAANI